MIKSPSSSLITPAFRTITLASLLLFANLALAQQSKVPGPDVTTEEPSDQQTPGVEINDANAQEALERQFYLNRQELSGLIVDRTMTMAGKTFYRAFSQLGMQDPILNNIVLTVHERPDQRWGSQVWISERNSILFRSYLSPRISEADNNAQAALEAVQESVLRSRISAALQSTKDLAEEEL